ncbi:MAG: SUMF1/EgtB/PvdO family nonheme iron enzyme [Nitrospirae bacterium]|nr:SUMF1/EgtB/PvdO family nonheme iron enzyme [Magnetococcales bacterium]HAT50515.1 hypothetical protein [Alphaproteobacteria bacterium]
MGFPVDDYRPWLEWVHRQTNTITVSPNKVENNHLDGADAALPTALFFPSLKRLNFSRGYLNYPYGHESINLKILIQRRGVVLVTEENDGIPGDVFLRIIANVLARNLLNPREKWDKFIQDDRNSQVPLLLDLGAILRVHREKGGESDLFSSIFTLMEGMKGTPFLNNNFKNIFLSLCQSNKLILLLNGSKCVNDPWPENLFSQSPTTCLIIVISPPDWAENLESQGFTHYVLSPLKYSSELRSMALEWARRPRELAWDVISGCFHSHHRWQILESYLGELTRKNRSDLEWFCLHLVEQYQTFSPKDIARAVAILGRVLDLFPAFKINPIPSVKVTSPYYALLGRFSDNIEENHRKGIHIPMMDLIDAAEALGRAGDPRIDAEKGRVNIDKKKWKGNLIHLPGTRFRLGKYPVTVGEYQKFLNSPDYGDEKFWRSSGPGGSRRHIPVTPDGWIMQRHHPNRPVVNVSWHEANAYCEWFSEKLGEKARLPTPVERKKAASTHEYRYPWGREVPKAYLANYGSIVGSPVPVGLYADDRGPEGHRDIVGNVREWGSKVDQNNAYALSGGWHSPPEHMVVGFHENLPLRKREGDLGFRVLVERRIQYTEQQNHLQPWIPYPFAESDPIHRRVVFLFPGNGTGKEILQFSNHLRNKLVTLFQVWKPFDEGSGRHLAFHPWELTPGDLTDPDKGGHNTHLWVTADLGVVFVWAESWDIFRALAARDLVRAETLVLVREDPSSLVLPKRLRGDYYHVPPFLMGESNSRNSGPNRVPVNADLLDPFREYVARQVLRLRKRTKTSDHTPEMDEENISRTNAIIHPLAKSQMPEEFLDYWQTNRPCILLRIERIESGMRWDEGKWDESHWGNQHASEPVVTRTNPSFRQWLGLPSQESLTVSELWQLLTDVLGMRSTHDDGKEGSTDKQFNSAVNRCNELLKSAAFTDSIPNFSGVVEWLHPHESSPGIRFQLLARHVNAFDDNRAMEILFLIALEPVVRKKPLLPGDKMRLLILHEHTDTAGTGLHVWLQNAIKTHYPHMKIVLGLEPDLRTWGKREEGDAWLECDAAIILRPGTETEKILGNERHPLVARMNGGENLPLLVLYEITQNPWLPDNFKKKNNIYYYETGEVAEILDPLMHRIQGGMSHFRPKIFVTHAIRTQHSKSLNQFLWKLVDRLERTGFEVLIEQRIQSEGKDWMQRVQDSAAMSHGALAVVPEDGLSNLMLQHLTWLNKNRNKEHFLLLPIIFADEHSQVGTQAKKSPLLNKWQLKFLNPGHLADEEQRNDICRQVIQPFKTLKNRLLKQTVFAQGTTSDEQFGQ